MSADDKGEGPKHAAGEGQISPEDRAAIRQRSEELGRKLDAINAKRAEAEKELDTARQTAFGQAFRYSAELLVGVGLGGVLGWALDRQFGTAPWLMILLVILGFSAGLLNVIRAAQKAQAENEALQRAAPSVTDDEEDEDK
ncbi:MAG: ATP F0F1 synthase subunit I [Hyphomicrobium sp.]|nr:ATP F0F1 synthase subunit I [Hyphomicrobium sp.]